MEKKDLKAGYTLEDEKGRKWYLLDTKDGLMAFQFDNYRVVYNDQIHVEKALKDNLTLKNKDYNPGCDIVKVYDLPRFSSDIFNGNYTNIKVLWERKKTKVTIELTDEQIESFKKQGIIKGEYNEYIRNCSFINGYVYYIFVVYLCYC